MSTNPAHIVVRSFSASPSILLNANAQDLFLALPLGYISQSTIHHSAYAPNA